jgi:hypothetical protein
MLLFMSALCLPVVFLNTAGWLVGLKGLMQIFQTQMAEGLYCSNMAVVVLEFVMTFSRARRSGLFWIALKISVYAIRLAAMSMEMFANNKRRIRPAVHCFIFLLPAVEGLKLLSKSQL